VGERQEVLISSQADWHKFLAEGDTPSATSASEPRPRCPFILVPLQGESPLTGHWVPVFCSDKERLADIGLRSIDVNDDEPAPAPTTEPSARERRATDWKYVPPSESLWDWARAQQVQEYHDNRGYLVEAARSDTTGHAEMCYFSWTKPGVTRGPHEHRRQTDCFLFLGPAHVWLWDDRPESSSYGCRTKYFISTDGGNCPPFRIIVPPGVVHAYRAAGLGYLQVINCPDRLYAGWQKAEPVDEIRHEDDPHTPFIPW